MRTKQDRLRVLKTVLAEESVETPLRELPVSVSGGTGAAGLSVEHAAGSVVASAGGGATEKSGGSAAVGASIPRTDPPRPAVGGVPRLRSGRPVLPSGPRRVEGVPGATPGRLVSLDAFRGFIMTMLAAGGFGILKFSQLPEDAPVWTVADRAFWQGMGFHFEHPAWLSVFDGWRVSFWDLIQPAFMFMVGVAMPFSYVRRRSQGHGWLSMSAHAILRAVVLVLLGVLLSSLGKPRTNWIFPNVLCQIGLGYYFAWLLLNRGLAVQVSVLVLLLCGYWGWFRINPPAEGYDYVAVNADVSKGEVFEGKWAAWSKNANAAYLVDDSLLRSLRNAELPAVAEDGPAAVRGGWRAAIFGNPEPYVPNVGGYTTLNFVPSIATTLLGILCGECLLSLTLSRWQKLLRLVLLAVVCLGLGLLAHATVCPAVKRIWTPSWALVSGGYVIGMLAVFYVLFDLLPLRWLAFPLVVVGTNSILIYVLGQTLNGWVREQFIRVHFAGVIEQLFGPRALDPAWYGAITMPTAVFATFWLLLFWLYRQRIFLRI
ncbi:MAG: hypothetical protein RL215_186 [Planctomycetota bacterium]